MASRPFFSKARGLEPFSIGVLLCRQLLVPSLSPSLLGTNGFYPLISTKLTQAVRVPNFSKEIQLLFERFIMQFVSQHNREFAIEFFHSALSAAEGNLVLILDPLGLSTGVPLASPDRTT